MALADSYAPHARSSASASIAGARSSGTQAVASHGIGLSPSARPQNRAQNTAMQYQRAQIETASPTRLIIMLHEGAIRFCQIALDAMTRKDLNAQHTNLLKAQRIVAHLLASLNHEKGGEVAKSLAGLYPSLHDQLVNANRYDQPEAVKEVQATLRSLCESWLEVERLVSGAEENQELSGAGQRSISSPVSLSTPKPAPRSLQLASPLGQPSLSQPSLSQPSLSQPSLSQSAPQSFTPAVVQPVSRLGNRNA